MQVTKLKQREVAEYRERLRKDKPRCTICGEAIKEEDAVLDHCHKTGRIRETLHRECNALEGKVQNFVDRFMRNRNKRRVLRGLEMYHMKDFSGNPIHPKHKTPEEKQVAVLKKRIKKAKRESTKERLRAEIKEIQDAKLD